MSSKKVKVIEVEPRLVESIPLLRSASKLYQAYTKLAAPPGVHDIQLCRFGDYLKHFGFALEKELPQPSNMVDNLASTKGMGTTTKRLLPPLLRGANDGADELIADAAWGISNDLRQEADARSAEVDVSAMLNSEVPPPGLVEEVAKLITLPFERVSRMQSPTQCAIKKARCLYTWLASHVVVTLELAPPITPNATTRGGANAKKKKNTPKPPKEKKKKSGGKDGKKGDGGADAAVVEEEVEPLPDPLVTALTSRLATPLLMANLYTTMLTSVGLSSRVIEGLLKGPSSEEALEWAWNVVEIDDRAYLVDIAYSSYTGPLRKPKPDAKANEGTAGGAKGKGKGPAAAPPPKKDAKKDSEPPSPRLPSVPGTVPPFMSLTKPPSLAIWRRKVEDFYFFTNPAQFIHTHLPYSEANTLLCEPPTRVAWDLAPRQTHSIFQFGVSLSSHRRNQCFTVRSAPFYLTFKNENPSNIQLCCALFKCSLWELPEDLQQQSTITQLPPEFVWHQRRESDNTECFTVTVPEGGFYSAVIGARYIREDPYTSAISDVTFTPIVEYQMKVNFVPIATPTFPRQHLSPNLCRLMTPLSRNILAGPQQFAVMPLCSNIAAVAIVRYQPPSARNEITSAAAAAAAAAAGGLGGENDDLLHGSREILTFLPFSAEIVTYIAELDLEPSAMIEIWVLYRAPDKNGFTFQEKVAIQEKERVPTPPPTPPPLKSKKQVKKKAPAVDPVSSEEVEMAKLLAEVAAGRAFLPFVTGIQTKTLLTRETGGIIQPQPSIESEKAPVMRRLAGITPQLYDVATDLQRHAFRPVGGYFPRR